MNCFSQACNGIWTVNKGPSPLPELPGGEKTVDSIDFLTLTVQNQNCGVRQNCKFFLQAYAVFFGFSIQLQPDIFVRQVLNYPGVGKSLGIHLFTKRTPVCEHVGNDQLLL